MVKVYIDKTAIIIGDCTIGDGVSIWPYAVLRGDMDRIEVGDGSNIQEHAVLHVEPKWPTLIGKDVTIGHGAIVNGAVIGDRCIIGMNSSIIEGAFIGDECIIGAGAVITGKMRIPSRSVVVGSPGKLIKSDDTSIAERAMENARHYHKLRDEQLMGKYKRQVGP